MKKPYRSLSFVLILALCLSVFSIAAFAAEVDGATGDADIFNSYYYSDKQNSNNIVVKDPYSVVDEKSVINTSKLIPIFSTNTNTNEALLDFCKKIGSGTKATNLITSAGMFYTITTDKNGNATGYAVVDASDFSVSEFGELNEYTRQEFQLTDAVKANLESKKVDMRSATAVFCIINTFSVGTLLYDDNNEYFIPSVESMENMGLVTVGEMYLVSDIAKIIESNSASILPNNEVDEFGTPHVGGVNTSYMQAAEHETANRSYTLALVLAIVFLVGAIACYILVSRSKRNTH